MSRLINFASNLLDGVDSMAKGSLTDQDLAAAAAERQRNRRRRKEQMRGDTAILGGSSAAEQSEGGLSEDGSHYSNPGVRRHGREARPMSVGDHYGMADEEENTTADEVSEFVGEGGRQTQASAATAYEAGAAVAVPRARANDTVRQVVVSASADTPGKEDGGVWSDLDAFSSAAPSPRSRGRVADGGDEIGVMSPSRRPPRLQGNLIGLARDPTDVERNDREEVENETVDQYPGEEGEGDSRVPSIADVSSVSNASLRVNTSLSPAMSPRSQHQNHQHRQDLVAEALGDGSGARVETAGGAVDDAGSTQGGGVGVDTGGIAGAASTVVGPASSATGGSGLQGINSSVRGVGGRGRKGLGNLLGMGGGRSRRSGGDEDADALKAEVAELREEVEELSLELEDAEDRLRGQEMELQAAAEEMKRYRVEVQWRKNEMEREMEEFRALQAEEKKVFLANLGEAEQKLKDKERQTDKARSALSALEAFAMESDDATARLKHEKEELLEALKGVRSGQDHSAEELREALTRAEGEKEEAESRHRAWMRQAQARQTELEATATQLGKALAEAKRRNPAGGDEESREGGARAAGERGLHSLERELRAVRDELESCQASLELEQERARSLQQEVTVLVHDLEAARATEAVVEKQRQEHANLAADAFAKASRLEQQLQQEKALLRTIGAAVPASVGSESQIQLLSSKLLDKQARLEESVRERATLSVKLKDALERANRAEYELRESRGDSLETGADVGAPGVRSRRRLGTGFGGRSSGGAAWSRLAPIAKHKKIATAIDVIDRRTLQAAVFIRNSSMARAVFVGYLLFLHVWAFAIFAFHSSNMKPPPDLPPGTGDPSG